MSNGKTGNLNEILSKINILELAETFGVHVRVRASGNAIGTARCPFHDDKTPSMTFYARTAEGVERYHCFGCQASGDAIDFTRLMKNTDFAGAVQFLSESAGIERTRPRRSTGKFPQTVLPALSMVSKIYSEKSHKETLVKWARQRSLSLDILSDAEVSAALGNTLSRKIDESDRETRELLADAGLMRRPGLRQSESPQGSLPIWGSWHDHFYQTRIIFPLFDWKGGITGFAGRSVNPDEKPKYLYSRGIHTSQMLYRANAVFQRAYGISKSDDENPFEVFIVEGLVDALRLESLGLNAVAAFGANLHKDQIELIKSLVKIVDRNKKQLLLHLFFDRDDAGARAAMRALPPLLGEAAGIPGFVVDVIVPQGEVKGKDPDELFKSADKERDHDNIREQLKNWSVSPMSLLLSEHLKCIPSEIETSWAELSAGRRAYVLRNIERTIEEGRWSDIIERAKPFEIYFTKEAYAHSWENDVRNYLCATPTSQSVARNTTEISTATNTGRQAILRAMEIAQSSSQRREFPVDHGSWERLRIGADAFFHVFKARLKSPERVNGMATIEPMIGVVVPKSGGRERLKAGPCPEDLTIQQYVLNALLTEYEEAPEFAKAIPALRFSRYGVPVRNTPSGEEPPILGSLQYPLKLQTTGPYQFTPQDETVSFAYQVRMDVIQGVIPPAREGMFRPYYECWQDFLNYVAQRTTKMNVQHVHVARLDVQGFYDNLLRQPVVDIMLGSVQRAMQSFLGKPQHFAPLFKPEISNSDQRAREIVDWLCDQSFGFHYYDPGDGSRKESVSPIRGIPQGPDLSAYLANVSLFPLDKRMLEEVHRLDGLAREKQPLLSLGFSDDYQQKVSGGVYARYVDDMIIVAETASDLGRMRRIVEESLIPLGLELSPKTTPDEAMSVSEFRGWLTDRRGAAMGASGVFGDPIPEVSLDRLGTLADAGDIERGDALRILHGPAQDDPATPEREVERAISEALKAPELRHGEYVAASRGVWRLVAQHVCSNHQDNPDADLENSPQQFNEEVASEYGQRWKQCLGKGLQDEPSDEKSTRCKDLYKNQNLLIAMEGLERFLCKRSDEYPGLSTDRRSKILDWRKCLAKHVNDGLLDNLENVMCSPNSVPSSLKHMFSLRASVIRWAAAQIVPHDGVSSITDSQNGAWRFSLSEAEVTENWSNFPRAGLEPRPGLGFDWLHIDIARLRSWQNSKRETSDNLSATSDPLDFTPPDLEAASPEYERIAALIHRLWKANNVETQISGDDSNIDKVLPRDALHSLVNVVGNLDIGFLGKRTHLLGLVFDKAGMPNNSLNLWPVPPGLSIPGLVGKDGCSLVRLVFSEKNEETPFHPILEWQKGSSCSRINAETFALQTGIDFLLNDRPKSTPDLLKEVSRWFRNLERDSREVDSCKTDIVPTAFNLLDASEENSTMTVGYLVAKNEIGNWAYVRQGEHSLKAISVTADHARLWRIGIALSDVLGRAESVTTDAAMHLKKSSLQIEPNEDWKCEAMLRIALARLSGKYWRPTASASDELPISIERVLKRLENFPADDDKVADNKYYRLAYLLEGSFWGRAYLIREKLSYDITRPGGVATYLDELASFAFRLDEEFANELPVSSRDSGISPPQRRTAFAWYRVGLRIRQLPPSRELECLIAACFVRALREEMMAAVLERLSVTGISENHWDEYSSSLPPGALLHRNQPENDTVVGLKMVTDTLSAVHSKIEKPDLWGITPLGWLTVLCGFVGLSVNGKRNAITPRWGVCFEENGMEKITDLITQLQTIDKNLTAALQQESGNDLFDGIPSDFLSWCSDGDDGLHDAFFFIKTLDDLNGIIVNTHCQSEYFDLRSDKNTKYIFKTRNEKEYCVPAFLVRHSGVSGDKKYEFHQSATSDAGSTSSVHYWSESWTDDRLLGVGIVKQYLAHLAQMEVFYEEKENPKMIESAEESTAIPGKESEAVLPSLIDTEIAKEKIAEPILEPSTEVNFCDDEVKPQPLTGHFKSSNSILSSPSKSQDPLEQFKILQEKSWASRSHRVSKAHVRVALLQWSVNNDSYRHPLFDVYEKHYIKTTDSNGDTLAMTAEEFQKNPCKWMNDEVLPSRNEYRRRKMLEEALRACGKLEVDILVIPEYTTLPDTVFWLEEKLKSYPGKRPLSVWAGTFISHSTNSVLVELDAEIGRSVLSVLLSKEKGKIKYKKRFKKYPSLAVSEVFWPLSGPISPVAIDHTDPEDPLSCIIELICSETFVASSPTNHRALAMALWDLSRRYGVVPSGTATHEEWAIDQVVNDIKEFTKHTALASKRVPRSILLVPAMTSRTQDFQVLGQSSFLAAGLTTVFCNAVLDKYGHGGSCFIGADCWDSRKVDKCGMPTSDPYHGVAPGIFHQNRLPRGALGKTDQALVIADIDPIRSHGGQPRPQTLVEPLRLVAHLPLLGCSNDFPSPEDIGAVVDILKSTKGNSSQISHPEVMIKQLRKLVSKDDDPGWWKLRIEAFGRNHLVNIQSSPFPVAVDWLPIQLEKDRTAEISVPPYCNTELTEESHQEKGDGVRQKAPIKIGGE